MTQDITKHLDRELGVFSVFSISLGAMMGSGIFVLPMLAALIAGPWVALSYVFAGLLVLPALLSKAELATAMPISGGTYVYLDRSMGPWVGTITGLGTWLALMAKTAFALVGLGAYLHIFSDVDPLPFTLLVLLALLVLNIAGASKASLLQRIIVLGCLATLTLFSIGGLQDIQVEHFSSSFPPSLSGIFAGASFVFVSYAGVTKACSLAEEVRNPGRNLPLGMLAAHFTAIALYVAVSFVITGVLDINSYQTLSAVQEHELLTPVATAANAFWGDTGRTVFSIVAISGLISMCNAGIMSSSRYPFAMARDALMPERLSAIGRFGTPAASILLTGVVLFILVLLLPVEDLAHLASAVALFIFCMVNVAVIVLRESGAQWYKPIFKTPGYPWVQFMGIVGGLFLLYFTGIVGLLGCTLAVAAGTAWYLAFARKRVDRRSAFGLLRGERVIEETEHYEQDENAPEHPPRVIVPIFGVEPAPERLIHLAAAFVEEGYLEVVRLEELPDQTALGAMLEADETARKLAQEADETARELHLTVEFHDVVTHNAKEALRQHAIKTQAAWIVKEWPTRKALPYLIRHPMAWWLDHPPCNLAIFHDAGVETFERILVLAKPGPYDSLLAHIADLLALQSGGRVTLLHAGESGEEQEHIAYLDELGKLCECPTESKVVMTHDLARHIHEATKDFDLLIMGAPRERGVRSAIFGSPSNRIVDQAQCSVLRLKAPHHKVHHSIPRQMLDDLDQAQVYQQLIEESTVTKNLVVKNKRELFTALAAGLSKEKQEEVAHVLWMRERAQNTALSAGIQMVAPNHTVFEKTSLHIFILAESVDFGAPDKHQVDVCFIATAPLAERRKQLWLLEQLSHVVASRELIDVLRAATDDDVRKLLLDA